MQWDQTDVKSWGKLFDVKTLTSKSLTTEGLLNVAEAGREKWNWATVHKYSTCMKLKHKTSCTEFWENFLVVTSFVFRIMFICSRPTGTMEIFVSLNDKSVKSFPCYKMLQV